LEKIVETIFSLPRLTFAAAKSVVFAACSFA